MFDFVIGVLIAALAGMGVGGGGLLVLYLVFIKDMAQLEAQGINLVFFVFAASSSLLYHIRKREIRWKLAIIVIGVGVAGAYFGAKTAAAFDPQVLRRLFGWLMTLSGVIVLFGGKIKRIKNKFFQKRG